MCVCVCVCVCVYATSEVNKDSHIGYRAAPAAAAAAWALAPGRSSSAGGRVACRVCRRCRQTRHAAVCGGRHLATTNKLRPFSGHERYLRVVVLVLFQRLSKQQEKHGKSVLFTYWQFLFLLHARTNWSDSSREIYTSTLTFHQLHFSAFGVWDSWYHKKRWNLETPRETSFLVTYFC